jgi:hypothetical protein
MTLYQRVGREKLRVHLGDGMFVYTDNGRIKLHVLSTIQGKHGDQEIWLDEKQLEAFLEWLTDVRAALFRRQSP